MHRGDMPFQNQLWLVVHTGLQVTPHLVFVPLLVLACFFVFSLWIFRNLLFCAVEILVSKDLEEGGQGGERGESCSICLVVFFFFWEETEKFAYLIPSWADPSFAIVDKSHLLAQWPLFGLEFVDREDRTPHLEVASGCVVKKKMEKLLYNYSVHLWPVCHVHILMALLTWVSMV